MANPNQPFGGFGNLSAPNAAGEAPKLGMSSFSFGGQAQSSTAAGGPLSAVASSQPFGQTFGQGLAKPATTPTAFSLGAATAMPPLTTGGTASSTSSLGFGTSGGAFTFGSAGLPVGGVGGASTSGSGSATAPAFGLGSTTATAPQGGFSFGGSVAPSIGFGTTPATAAVTVNAATTSTATTTAAGIPVPATVLGGSLFGFNAPATSSVGFKPAGTGMSSFGFGAPAAAAAPVFGSAATAAPATSGGAPTFAFGGSAPAGSGASAGIAPSLGQTVASTSLATPTPSLASILSSTPAPNFSMAPGFTSTSGPTLGLGTSVTSATPTSFSSSSGAGLVVPSATVAITTSATTSTTATPSFGLGSPFNATATTAAGFGLGSSLSLSTASSTPFGGLASTMPPMTSGAAQQPGLKLGGSVSAPAAGGSMGLGGLAGISSKPEVSASTSASLLTAKATPTTTTGAAFSLPVQESAGTQTTSTAPTTKASTGLQLDLSTTATTGTAAPGGSIAGAVVLQNQAAAAAQTTSMTYKDLENSINEWSREFEEQERAFLQQATQINAWDRLLVENGEKITELNTDVDNVKVDQQRLSSELDFIVSQQKELEEMLIPLEKAFEQLPTSGSLAGGAAGSYPRHADVERERTYQMAVNIDAQLKRLVEEMREVVDHLNGSSDEASRNSDPMQQITKILDAHMDSLQWIDRSMETLQKKVDDAGKLSEQLRRDQERSFRLAHS